MRLLHLPPAIRLHLWTRYPAARPFQGAIATKPLSAGGAQSLLLQNWHWGRRHYATPVESDDNIVFKLGIPEETSSHDEKPLEYRDVMIAVEQALDEHSQASDSEKEAVLAALRSRVNRRGNTPVARRRELMGRLQKALEATDLIPAIRSALEGQTLDAKSTGQPAVRDAVDAGKDATEHANLDLETTVQPDGDPFESSRQTIVDVTYVTEHMPLPRDHPSFTTMFRLRSYKATPIREIVTRLLKSRNQRLSEQRLFLFKGGKEWHCLLNVRIDGARTFGVTGRAPNKLGAHLAAWLWVLSQMLTSGFLGQVKIPGGSSDPAQPPQEQTVLPKQEQYPSAPAELFIPDRVPTAIHNACMQRQLSPKAETTFVWEESLAVCTLSLSIEGIAQEESVGSGRNKQVAKRAAWVAMLNKLHDLDLLKRLFPPPGQQHNVAAVEQRAEVENTSNQEVEVVSVEDYILQQEKDAKVDIYNYAASYGLVPRFEITPLRRRVRRAGRLKMTSVIQVAICLPEQDIEVLAHGSSTMTTEVAAAIAFKRKAEQKRSNVDQILSHESSGFDVLTTETARDFVEYYRRSERGTSLEVEHEATARGGQQYHTAQLMINEQAVGSPPSMRTKAKAEEVAYLTAAVAIAHSNPSILAEFVGNVRKGKAKILGKHRPLVTTIDSVTLDRMRDTLVHSRRAGLPDVRQALVAETSFSREARPRRPPVESQEQNSAALLEKLRRFEQNSELESLRTTKASLPMAQHASQVTELIAGSVYSIIVGATGSGKTTQVPQIILDDAIRRSQGGACDIICTQPRRLAASSVAQRVATERNEPLRETVGFHVRGESKLPTPGGSITYCTTGILLEQLKWNADDIMDNCSHLVLDEVHERDILIDFLLIVLKKAIRARQTAGKKVPKVILMSATMDTKLFSEYLLNDVGGTLTPCPHLSVPGRTFPVQEIYLEDIVTEINKTDGREFSDMTMNDVATRPYLDSESAFARDSRDSDDVVPAGPMIDWKRKVELNADPDSPSRATQKEEALVPIPLLAATLAHICKTTSTEGAILAFLPGLAEITATENLLRAAPIFGVDFSNTEEFSILPLHSTVPVDKQREILEPVAAGRRKIILSTNIAETSVTVPDVKHVVDLGKMREKRYNQSTRISALQTVWVSLSNAKQRAGRAGRVSNGNYYALYSRQRRQTMAVSGLPEILRSDLQETCLSIKAQGFEESVSSFLSEAVESPPAKAVSLAVENLKAIEAFTDDESVTALGRVLSRLPVHPTLGKMVLLGIIFRCLDPMIIISSMDSGRSLFVDPVGMRVEAKRARQIYHEGHSDHIAFMNAFKDLRRIYNTYGVHRASVYAREHFIHFGAFRAILGTAQQIEQSLVQAGVIPQQFSDGFRTQKFGGDDLNVNSKVIGLIKCLILAGVHPNVGIRPKFTKSPIHRTPTEEKVMMHPSSTNYVQGKAARTTNQDDQIYAFGGLVRSVRDESLFMRDSTLITPLTAMIFGGRLQSGEGYKRLTMDDWLPFKLENANNEYTVRLVLEFRKAKDRMLHGVFNSLSNLDGKPLPSEDVVRDTFADGLVQVLTAAEGSMGSQDDWIPPDWRRQNRGAGIGGGESGRY